MSEIVQRKKAEVPENCPKCKVAPEARRKGSFWLLVCPNYVDSFSSCKQAGWTMGTKREAIEEGNTEVRAVSAAGMPQ